MANMVGGATAAQAQLKTKARRSILRERSSAKMATLTISTAECLALLNSILALPLSTRLAHRKVLASFSGLSASARRSTKAQNILLSQRSNKRDLRLRFPHELCMRRHWIDGWGSMYGTDDLCIKRVTYLPHKAGFVYPNCVIEIYRVCTLAVYEAINIQI